MIRLVLVRHAKSDWGDDALVDHDRPLGERGLRDAPHLAAEFARSSSVGTPAVGTVLSSTALRARTTAGFFAEALGLEVRMDDRLYGAPAAVLLRAAAESGSRAVMVVAHDPGMTTLAGDLSDGGITHMPTCAVASFTWDEDDWAVADAVPPAVWSFETPR